MAIGTENYHNKRPSNCSPNIRRKRKSSDRMLNPPPPISEWTCQSSTNLPSSPNLRGKSANPTSRAKAPICGEPRLHQNKIRGRQASLYMV